MEADGNKLAEPEGSVDQKILIELHRRIVDGTLRPGEKLSEVGIAKEFKVSRTPARVALKALEVEGFIKKREGRGFVVEQVDLSDLTDAYEVRGVLEGLAAATLARKGMTPEVKKTLRDTILNMNEALDSDLPAAEKATRYQHENKIFHSTIISECGNSYVRISINRMENLPLVAPGTVVFNSDSASQDLERFRLGSMQHHIIFDAICKRDVQRAEVLMREHANQTLVYSALFGLDDED